MNRISSDAREQQRIDRNDLASPALAVRGGVEANVSGPTTGIGGAAARNAHCGTFVVRGPRYEI
ncbi:MAG: hypothetical protein IIB77_07705 [Proteobacteria bacterium]|nr:hypothetical protein [Pseudomonadota bacterium]